MKIDARGWIFEVEAETADEWIEIGGLNSFDLNPGDGDEDTETTTFKSRGERESEAMQRGGALELEGLFETVDATPGEQDPGQKRVDVLGTKVSTESLGRLRFRHETETEWTIWTAWVGPGSRSGGINDKTAWAATFTRSGAATTDEVETEGGL